MSAKTTFWYGLVVALAVIGSAVALPLSTNDDSASENGKTVVLPEQPKESVATESAQSTGQTEDVAAVGSTDPSSVSQTVKTESADDGSTSTAAAAAATATSGAQNTEDVAVGSTSAAAESATGSDQSEPTTPATATGSDSQEPAAGAHVHDQRPKPYNEDNAATVKIGPSMPFYLEFFQPFQPLPMQSYPNRQNQLPTRHQQPFGAIIDPFDPFGNSPMPPFNQIIEAYTNEFRTPEVIIVKPKRNVRLNATTMPPIPLLMNIMLNAFRHNEPTEMLESFDQNMQRIPQQGEDFDSAQSGSNKPVTKTTTKTEIINGHVVQINETTYTNGDENHKSFYHFKEIQVLPEANNQKIANEKLTSLTKDDSEKIEMNEIKRDPDESFDDVVKPVNQPGLVKKNVAVASGPLGEYYQTAAASHYGSSYAPAYYVPKSAYAPMPSPPPVTWYDIINRHHQSGHHQPDYRPVYQPVYQPGNQPGYRPGHLSGYQAGHQPGYQPGHQSGYQSGYQLGHQHAAPGPHFGGAVGAPVISLSGDTLVNDLMAERLKASGAHYQLPADVMLVDVNELQSRPAAAPGARGVRRRSPAPQSVDDGGRRHVSL